MDEVEMETRDYSNGGIVWFWISSHTDYEKLELAVFSHGIFRALPPLPRIMAVPLEADSN